MVVRFLFSLTYIPAMAYLNVLWPSTVVSTSTLSSAWISTEHMNTIIFLYNNRQSFKLNKLSILATWVQMPAFIFVPLSEPNQSFQHNFRDKLSIKNSVRTYAANNDFICVDVQLNIPACCLLLNSKNVFASNEFIVFLTANSC